MKKDWGIKNRINPIGYMIEDTEIYNVFNHLQWIAQQNALKLDDGNEHGLKTLEMLNAVMNYVGFLKVYAVNIASYVIENIIE